MKWRVGRFAPRACTTVMLFAAAACMRVPGSDDSAGESSSAAAISTTAPPSGPIVPKASSADWPWWRGPNRNGIAEAGQDPPVRWSETENVIWKADIPGRGHSSPTVAGDRIYLATADERRQQQAVLAFDRATGKQLWLSVVSTGGFPPTHPKNTHATSTVACDGERVFATFHHRDKVTLFALDLDGKTLWSQDVGAYAPRVYQYGYAPSPLLYQDMVIVAGDYEKGGFLAAYNRESGKRIWRTSRPKMLSFSSPIVADIAGKNQLLISGCELVASYNPGDGKLLWSVQGTTMATCGTVVWDGDKVFASGGYPDSQTICVKADGSKTIVWTNNQKCYEQSMVATGGYLYAVTDQGIAYCWRGEDGQEMWRERLRGPVSASPMLVGDRIFLSNEAGTTFVFRANPEKFELLARNQLGEEAFATPSFCGNRIYARVATGSGPGRKEHLYCLGKTRE